MVAEPSDVLKELLANPVLGRSDPGLLAKIVPHVRRIQYRQNRPIIREGTRAESVYCLVAGGARVFHKNPNGGEIVVKLFAAPVFFGEADVLLGIDWLQSVETVMSSVVLEIPSRAFLALLRRDHGLANAIVEDLSARLLAATEQARQLACGSAEAIVASLLVDYLELFGKPTERGTQIELRLSQDGIAKSLSMSRKTVQRALESWRAEGILDKVDGRFVVCAPDKLRALTNRSKFGIAYKLRPLAEKSRDAALSRE